MIIPARFGAHGRAVLTLASGGAGGAVLALANLPAAWLAGALVVVALLALARVPVEVPGGPVRIASIVLGAMMGAGVTPETLRLVASWPITMAALALSIPAVTLATGYYLRRAGFDALTAFLAAVPGALSYVIALSLQSRADVARIAFVQTTRLFLLVVVLPAALAAGGELGGAPPAAAADGPPTELLAMLAASAAAGLLFERWHVPGGTVVGAMAASAVLHGTGLVSAAVPHALLAPCFVVLGAAIGARFAGTSGGAVRALSGVAVVAFAISASVAAAVALAAAPLVDVPLGQLVIAFAPGGLEAMVILGFALGFDPAFVAAHHLVRFLAIALVLPLVLALVLKRMGRDAS